ncbi:unnamed protein product [Miscanthus lutarioriparius]|uniref:Uncharacterized protein n=1 Tax=Miscanthus lutarioriparius TaxID=422564 RepID=A0A811SNB1_9POAL|nr:unnamed protein product [Miscanthus lutarioriparius]
MGRVARPPDDEGKPRATGRGRGRATPRRRRTPGKEWTPSPLLGERRDVPPSPGKELPWKVWPERRRASHAVAGSGIRHWLGMRSRACPSGRISARRGGGPAAAPLGRWMGRRLTGKVGIHRLTGKIARELIVQDHPMNFVRVGFKIDM